MKKYIFLTILLITFIPNIHAEECQYTQNDINNANQITYNLDYDSKYTTENGDRQENYFIFTPVNLPTNYLMTIDNNISKIILYNDEKTSLPGGVYTLMIFPEGCENYVKRIDFLVPYYKQYDVKKGITFDGTYENKNNNTTKKDNENVSIRLLVILGTLFVIIGVLISLAIIRNKKRRGDFE